MGVTGGGASAVQWALPFAAALVVVSLLLSPLGLVGPWYLAGAAVLGVWLLRAVIRASRHTTMRNARGVFITSVAYLPLVLILAVLDKA